MSRRRGRAHDVRMTTITALRAAALFDGDRLIPDPIVLIEGGPGGTVLAAGSGVPVPDGAAVVDMPGATILPGLVDGHVHLSFDASLDPVGTLAARDDAEAFAAMMEAARRTAAGGVTTVRDLGDRGFLTLGVREASRTDRTLPHVLVAGVPLTVSGGHCHFLGEPADGPDGLRIAIAERAERGVDAIKIMASGGNMTPGSKPHEAQYSLDDLRVAVEEAHRYGLPIVAHAHGGKAIAHAVEAGVDGLEHVSFMTQEDVDDVPDELLAEFGRGELTLGLTFGFKTIPGGPPMPTPMASRMPRLVANARRLREAGARIIVGSDSGIAPFKPADAVRHSLPQLLALGMTPAEALHAITARAATALGLGDRKGRVAPGYDADLLIVDGDPLADPEAIHRIRAVYIAGSPLPG
jgi:imidazolonepropionase-like amidohydrolase